MSKGLTVGATLPDFALPDHDGVVQTLSELQGADPMILMLGRGEHCPRERQHQREMLRMQEWLPVAFTSMVTVLPGVVHDADKLRLSTGAWWPFLADTELEVQKALEIDEYTDPHHDATVPHTLVLDAGLRIDKVYVGYWYWGRPSAYQLWTDLQDLMARTKADFDPTTADARAAWAAARPQAA
ncbi:MAG TPA: redoxin domain-containing protein [Solirubrobacteraceae bacterium]|nr:redoxin domain-containing protein [Solirubrobacteraceae bacterium]